MKMVKEMRKTLNAPNMKVPPASCLELDMQLTFASIH